jgi:hypothetical protein
MNAVTSHRWKLIRWELAWIAVEASVSAIGLWLMLGIGLVELGTGILFLLIAASFFVRWSHYSNVAPSGH